MFISRVFTQFVISIHGIQYSSCHRFSLAMFPSDKLYNFAGKCLSLAVDNNFSKML